MTGKKSHSQGHTALEKEFELERMILFTDAVFAIAITLLVIDIKWPDLPPNVAATELPHLFKTTIWQFLAFVLSFVFIGQAWAIHLELFRLLRSYDKGLIKRNLVFLFFIVTFPFAAAGISGHVQTGFLLPIFVYMLNYTFAKIAHFLLCRYVVYQKPALSAEGNPEEKKYIYIRARSTAIIMISFSTLLLILAFFSPSSRDYIGFSLILIAVLEAYVKKKTRKYKPKTTTA